MTPLDAPVAIAAVAYSDIRTAHDGSPNNLFPILRFAAFRLRCAAAMRAARRQHSPAPSKPHVVMRKLADDDAAGLFDMRDSAALNTGQFNANDARCLNRRDIDGAQLFTAA